MAKVTENPSRFGRLEKRSLIFLRDYDIVNNDFAYRILYEAKGKTLDFFFRLTDNPTEIGEALLDLCTRIERS